MYRDTERNSASPSSRRPLDNLVAILDGSGDYHCIKDHRFPLGKGIRFEPFSGKTEISPHIQRSSPFPRAPARLDDINAYFWKVPADPNISFHNGGPSSSPVRFVKPTLVIRVALPSIISDASSEQETEFQAVFKLVRIFIALQDSFRLQCSSIELRALE